MTDGPGADALSERWEYMFVLAVEMDRAARLSTVSPQGEMIVVETENIWITGSQIPIRVPKSATARMLPTISPVDVITPDDMRRHQPVPRVRSRDELALTAVGAPEQAREDLGAFVRVECEHGAICHKLKQNVKKPPGRPVR